MRIKWDKLLKLTTGLSHNYFEQYKWTRFLAESEYYSSEQIYEFQLKKLQMTCNYAYDYVPYYKKLFDECGFDPKRFNYIDQLETIPFLTKEIIQHKKSDLISTEMPKERLDYFTTGGSTGIPTGLYSSKNVVYKENAFFSYIYGKLGFSPRLTKHVVLRGSFIGTVEEPISYDHNRINMSSYYMNDKNMKEYIDVIKNEDVQYIRAYPSAIFMLADYMKKNQIEPISSVKYVLLASENIYPEHRKIIEDMFGCKTFGHYGHVERVCLAPECEQTAKYHFLWQYGYTEFLNCDDKKPQNEKETVEIVGTSFDNYGMPLIRYRTMDLAEWTKQKCIIHPQYCLVNKIKGRIQELLVTKTGRYISMTAINMHSPVFDNVKQFQFYQNNPEYCIFKVVKEPTYTEKDEKEIYIELKRKLGDEIGLKIEYVNEIPKTRSGKYRFLVQELPVMFSEMDD